MIKQFKKIIENKEIEDNVREMAGKLVTTYWSKESDKDGKGYDNNNENELANDVEGMKQL